METEDWRPKTLVDGFMLSKDTFEVRQLFKLKTLWDNSFAKECAILCSKLQEDVPV